MSLPDFLVRNVPDDVLAAIDVHATRLGLSRDEYVRRELIRIARRSASPVDSGDLRTFGEQFCDLTSADLMDQAWQ